MEIPRIIVLLFVTIHHVGRPASAGFGPFSLFELIPVAREECQGIYQSGNLTKLTLGTCLTRAECENSFGHIGGRCSNDRGVCCLFLHSCGKESKSNLSYFVNPGWPLGFDEPSTCRMGVKKINGNICQIRLDLEEFRIVGPSGGRRSFRYHPSTARSPSLLSSVNRYSNCKDDLFIVSQGNRNHQIPIICGENTGQRIYVPLESSDSDQLLLTFLTGINDFSRKWRIRITQLECSDRENLAPQGCLQYHTTPKGTIRSFNYEGEHYLQNIDYSICIKRPKDMCFLTFKRNPPTADTSLNGTQVAKENIAVTSSAGTTPPSSAPRLSRPGTIVINGTVIQARAIIHDSCRHAGYWITWPGTDRICSEDLESLDTSVTVSTSAPQIVHFFSSPWDDSKPSNKGAHRGFSLSYTHSPCTHGYYG